MHALTANFPPCLSSDFSCRAYTFEWEIGSQTLGNDLNCTDFDGKNILRSEKFVL